MEYVSVLSRRENDLFTSITQDKKEKGSRFSPHILEEE